MATRAPDRPITAKLKPLRSASASAASTADAAGTPSCLPSVLLVAGLFHPVDHLAIDMLLDRDMGHGRRRRRTMPVLHARRKPDDVARPDPDRDGGRRPRAAVGRP